jgi:hypothetical protein
MERWSTGGMSVEKREAPDFVSPAPKYFGHTQFHCVTPPLQDSTAPVLRHSSTPPLRFFGGLVWLLSYSARVRAAMADAEMAAGKPA